LGGIGRDLALGPRWNGGKLVKFDNFTTLSDSLGDENSAGAMALTLMLKLKQAGICGDPRPTNSGHGEMTRWRIEGHS
jgi:hypothetical protein